MLNLSPNNTNVAADADGLHIVSLHGIQCLGATIITPPNLLVLATNRSTYDTGEIQQITKYVNLINQGNQVMNKMPLPSTLRRVLGGRIERDSTSHDLLGCDVNYQITNTSNAAIQIPRVAVRLSQASRPNTFHYRLIDFCTMIQHEEGSSCLSSGGGPALCSVHQAYISLTPGAAGATFGAAPTAGGTCPALTIAPQASIDLYITFDGPAEVYSVVPEFTLITSAGQNVVALPQLQSIIAFADTSQLACYGLQGNTFILETPTLLSWCL